MPGKVTGFLGPNGAGKTTTMRLILGLDYPSAGTARIDGKHYADLAYPMREVGALLDAKAVHGGRSGYNHLLCLAQTNNLPRKRVGEVLDLVGLTEVARRRTKGFFLGMAQRLGIAATLLGDPKVLMFEEPVNGLDPEGILWIRDADRIRAGRRPGRRPRVRAQIRSVRSTYWTLLMLLAVSAGIGAAISAVSASGWSTTPPADRTPLDATQLSIAGLLVLGQLVIVVAGALMLTAEYSTGMIRTSLIAMPRRIVLYAATAVAFAAVALVVSLATAFTAFFLASRCWPARTRAPPWPGPTYFAP